MSQMIDERLKILKINKYILQDILFGKKRIMVEMPEDTRIIDCRYDYKTANVEFILCSEKFEQHIRGMELATLENILIEDVKEEPKLVRRVYANTKTA